MQVKEKIGERNFLDLRICDNLVLMAEIKDNTIDLIYCDILYGTGRKFKDYQDLKPIRSEIESHYIPRIKEMHRILKKYWQYLFANGYTDKSLDQMYIG